jgi:hypothetical protein
VLQGRQGWAFKLNMHTCRHHRNRPGTQQHGAALSSVQILANTHSSLTCCPA